MKKIWLIGLIILTLGLWSNLCFAGDFKQNSKPIISLHSLPTEFEFKVYKWFSPRLWDLPIGRSYEEEFVKKTALKFGISEKDVDAIDRKFMWYEFEIQKRKSGYKIGELASMTWKEFKKWRALIGPPK